ncbi:MAG: glycosyltransferase [Phycisphaerales bacterium]
MGDAVSERESTRTSRPFRVLHLIDPTNPAVGACGAALLADLLAGQTVAARDSAVIVGGSGAERLARRVGLQTPDRIAPPAERGWLAATTLRRYLARRGPFDLIQAWSVSMLSLASTVAPTTPRAVMLLMNPDDDAEAHWLRSISGGGEPVALAITNEIRRAWAARGAPGERIHVLRPGLDFARVDGGVRGRIRHEWGVADETQVVAALAHPPSRIGGRRLGKALVIMRLRRLDVALVMSPGVRRRAAGAAIAEAAGEGDRLIFDERLDEPWRILPACDAGLLLGDDTQEVNRTAPAAPPSRTGRWPSLVAPAHRHHEVGPADAMSGVLPAHWAAVAGKPIVAEASYAATEVVENRHTGLLVTPGDDGAVVNRVAELAGDAQLHWKLRDAARSEAYSVFSRRRFVSDLRAVHEQIIEGRRVEPPPLPVTGGVAFGVGARGGAPAD